MTRASKLSAVSKTGSVAAGPDHAPGAADGVVAVRPAAFVQRRLAKLAGTGPRVVAQRAAVTALQGSARLRSQQGRLGAMADGTALAAVPVMQRYTVVDTKQQKPDYWQGLGAPLRVSDDGRMAVKHVNGAPSNSPDYQVFYATAGLIAASQQALTATGSAFTIAPGGNTLIGRAPGDKDAPVQTLVNAVTANTDLARIGKGSHTFNVCTANLSNFLGVLRGLPGDPGKLERRRDVELRLMGTLDHARRSVVIGEDLGVAMSQARMIVTGEDEHGAARNAYNGLRESMRQQISAQYGIDEAAVPDVGQGFGIIQGGEGGRSGMGHFAPVIAASGADRVTLENDVSQTEGREKHDIGQINPNWYFRMFGPVKRHWYGNEDQTFWGEARKHERADYGDRPLVATLGSKTPPAQGH